MAKISDLSWLTGHWKRELPNGMEGDETWTPATGSMMVGVGRTLRGGSLIFLEFMRARETEKGLELRVWFAHKAELSGGTAFAEKSSKPGEILFENLANDFPQRILYRSDGRDRLFARIEGGKGNPEEFKFRRTRLG
ncbi:MAG: hypothetical protein HUU60_11670 [Armatimonadetes bacterium]|nr:hypothetical protein [Armatimonadota bacterium]